MQAENEAGHQVLLLLGAGATLQRAETGWLVASHGDKERGERVARWEGNGEPFPLGGREALTLHPFAGRTAT